LAPHPLQPQRRAFRLEVDTRNVRLELAAGVREEGGDGDGDVGGVADGGVSFGELALASRGGVIAL
jgi:hypothetical protein